MLWVLSRYRYVVKGIYKSARHASDSTNSGGYNHRIRSSGGSNSSNRSCSIISNLTVLASLSSCWLLLAFSCCSLAFSSAFLTLSLFCFFSARFIFLFSFSKGAIFEFFAFSFCSNNAKLSSLVRSLACGTDLFGVVGVVFCTVCTR